MPTYPPDRIGCRPRPCAAFTLAELLAVIAIIGILLAVSVTSLLGITRGASLRAASAQLKSGLNLARQYAITHRQQTGVLFPTWNNDNTGTDSTKTKGYRAYAMFVYSNGLPSAFVSDWIFLPSAVIITTNSAVFSGAATNAVSWAGSGLANPNNIPVLCFKLDGSVSGSAVPTERNINLSEGYINASGVPTIKGTPGTNQVMVNVFTGSVRVQ